MAEGIPLVHGNTGSEFLTTCDIMLKEKCDIQHAIKQGCSCVPCVSCSVMPKPNTGTILCWRSSPCGGCGGRKGENEIKALRKTVGSGG